MARRTAAFYDLDGTLLDGTVVDHYLYYALHDPHLPSRAKRFVEAAVKAPYFKYLDRLDRKRFNEVFYASYAGLSEDRLALLGENLFERVLKRKLYEGVSELLERDRDCGHYRVLVTGALDFVANPVARHLGIERVVASRLEFAKNGLATGVLRPPVIAGPAKASWIREFAEEEDLDLERSVAYSDDAADMPMLSMVGRPVAVNPDRQLLATARSHGWPVLWIDAGPRSLGGRLARGAVHLGQRAARALQEEGEERLPEARSSLAGLRDLGGRLRTLAAEVVPGPGASNGASDDAPSQEPSR